MRRRGRKRTSSLSSFELDVSLPMDSSSGGRCFLLRDEVGDESLSFFADDEACSVPDREDIVSRVSLLRCFRFGTAPF